MSVPLPLIGVDEPMFVSGAIARTSAAWEIQTPAEAALAPFGPTHTTTGIFSESSRCDDLAHRLGQASGRVEHDHRRCVAAGLCAPELVVQPVLRDRVDLGLEMDRQHTRRRRCARRERERGGRDPAGQEGDEQAFHRCKDSIRERCPGLEREAGLRHGGRAGPAKP